jgi:hypothetical protein
MLHRIDCDEGSSSKMRARGVQTIHHDGADLGRENILCSHLNDTGCITSLRCQEPSKIEVLGEDYVSFSNRKFHDLFIRRGWLADVGPVNGLQTRTDEEMKSARG